jgi:ADP-heptose:LPS heptosyltransferase
MATSTPPNLLEQPQDEVIKVIAIKLPFDLQERTLTFPLLHLVHTKYPEADLHLITPKKNLEILNLLPFRAYYHEFDEDEIATVFDVHPFTANAKIFNVDIFISLTNSFVDGCLGVGLRAKKRVGFSDRWKTLLFTHKTLRPVNHHLCEDYFSLYQALLGVSFDSKFKVMSRELTPVIENWDSLPYIAIDLAPLRGPSIDEDLFNLINCFENQRILLFASEDQEKIRLIIEPFLARLSKLNVYVDFLYPSWIELAKMLAFARGVISFNPALANISAYVGARTLALYERENPQRLGPFYFLSDVMTLSVSDPTLAVAPVSNGVIQERQRFNIPEIYGKAFEFFKLVINR